MKFQKPSLNFFCMDGRTHGQAKTNMLLTFFFGTIKQVFLPCISVALKISVSSLQWKSLRKMMTDGL